MFVKNLEMSCLLYGDACAHISSLSRQAEKAEYFLDHMILPSIKSGFWLPVHFSHNEIEGLCALLCCEGVSHTDQ